VNEPADVDPAEFPAEDAETTVDGGQQVLEETDAAAPVAAIPEQNTAPHKVRELPGFDIGYRAGLAAGLLQGRADVRAQDRQDAFDDFEAALRLYLFENGVEHGEHLAATVRKRVKRI